MAFTAYRTFVAGEIVTAAMLNQQIRDNGRYIHGDDGVPTILSGLTIDNTDGDERLLLPLLSTAECSTVLNAEGEVAFDETTHQMKEYDGTAVRVVLSEADVDDTPVNGATTVPVSSNWAYGDLNIGTTAGDLLYYTAAGVRTRLGIGTVGQVLRTNAGENAPEWAASVATKQFFVPCFHGSGGALSNNGDFAIRTLTAGGHKAIMSFRLPNDFASLTSVKVLIIPATTGTFDWSATTDWGANGEAYNANSDSATADGQAATDTQILELDISAAFTGVAANDNIGCTFTLDVLTTTTVVGVIGLDVKYV